MKNIHIWHSYFWTKTPEKPTRENWCNRSEGFILLSSRILSTTRVPIPGSPFKENLGNRRKVRYTSLCKSLIDLNNTGEAPLYLYVMPTLRLCKPAWESWRAASPLLCNWSRLIWNWVLALLAQKPQLPAISGLITEGTASLLRGFLQELVNPSRWLRCLSLRHYCLSLKCTHGPPD